MTLTLTLPAGDAIYTGKQVTFRSPCNSEGLTGLIVNQVTYSLMSAVGAPLVGNSFSEGALVSVVFNAETLEAFVLNADTNAYLEFRLAECYSADNKPTPLSIGAAPAPIISQTDITAGSTALATGRSYHVYE